MASLPGWVEELERLRREQNPNKYATDERPRLEIRIESDPHPAYERIPIVPPESEKRECVMARSYSIGSGRVDYSHQ